MQESKGNIDLNSVVGIRFAYYGHVANPSKQPGIQNSAESDASEQPFKQKRPLPSIDDAFKVFLKNGETFAFKSSKILFNESFPTKASKTHTQNGARDPNPSIEKWEKAIRKFNKNVSAQFN